MDLMQLQERVVLQEARALELGMANPTPSLTEELRYALQEVNALRGSIPAVNGTSVLRARADAVYAELMGIYARWGDVTCGCAAA